MSDGSQGSQGSRAGNWQEGFHARWPQLRDPHVRALAWLLEAPDLMAADAPCWGGRIGTLGPMTAATAAWLQQLQDDPALHGEFEAHMAHQPSGRLGRYAEKLLGFFLAQHGRLVAANLQVRNTGPTRETLGEFDFLLRPPAGTPAAGLIHWEFATKFYLLESVDPPGDDATADAFVGPNLADSLGRKMRKIMDQQLMLSQHPAAQAVLPEPEVSAQALVKGWLFYRDGAPPLPPSMGIAAGHCRGFWCDAAALSARGFPARARFVLLPRLAWLAPARLPDAAAMPLSALLVALNERFLREDAPVMVAVCRSEAGDEVLEVERGFIVPPDWQQRAAETVRHAVVRV